jgi:uncharacterized protein YbjT (DUF2867 family)
MNASTKIAVAGATGRVGRHIVDVLTEQGRHVVPISRSHGVDVVTGAGLADALTGVEVVVDAATSPSPAEQEATDFFTASARNIQSAGQHAGLRRLVVVSIVGCDRFGGGYGAAKVVHEQATLDGAIPARVLRASQFHEFVPQLLEWGTQGDVAYVPRMRTQLVAARAVAEALADLATAPEWRPSDPVITEIAGPREERLVAVARLFAARNGGVERIEEVSDPADPHSDVFENGGLLPGPEATLAGPTFEEWLDALRHGRAGSR